MAEAVLKPVPVEEDDQLVDDSLGGRFAEWVRTELVWYAGSFTIHLLGLSLLLLIPNAILATDDGDALKLDEAKAEKLDNDKQTTFEKFDIGEIEDEQPTELDVDPTLEKPGHEAQTEDYIDDSPIYTPKGGGTPTGNKDLTGGGGFNVIAYGNGAKVSGVGGVGVGLGTGKNWGSGGDGVGFGGRGSGSRKAMLAQHGGTKHTERAVTGALVWLANHQNTDGSWSLEHYTQRCRDQTCTGPGNVHADAGATAMGVLPFLAAGQTHKTRGPYRGNIANAINWLIKHQQPDGNLAKDCHQPMYSHGLATIALCEAYGLSGDRNIGMAAQGAVNYVINAQNQGTGGWRYNPGDEGDTSVVGWQIMALKSAQMAGLNVGGSTFGGASKWLDSVQSGPYNSLYAYTPGQGHSNTMTSVGLLCRQYLGAKREGGMMNEGVQYLLKNLPDVQLPNIYYWYYASQVLHNFNGYEWDTWNRKMRKILVDSQCKDSSSCANGSWDPAGDLWGKSGGRVMMTSLSTLTLEIYYRYLPLFKAESNAGGAGGAAAFAKGGKADAPKADGDKAEAPKADGDKAEAPKADAEKTEKAPAAE